MPKSGRTTEFKVTDVPNSMKRPRGRPKKERPVLRNLGQYKDPINSLILGINVRNARIKCGLTQIELTGMANVSRSTLAKIEDGSANPNLETLVALSHAMGIRVADLLSTPAADSMLEFQTQNPELWKSL